MAYLCGTTTDGSLKVWIIAFLLVVSRPIEKHIKKHSYILRDMYFSSKFYCYKVPSLVQSMRLKPQPNVHSHVVTICLGSFATWILGFPCGHPHKDERTSRTKQNSQTEKHFRQFCPLALHSLGCKSQRTHFNARTPQRHGFSPLPPPSQPSFCSETVSGPEHLRHLTVYHILLQSTIPRTTDR